MLMKFIKLHERLTQSSTCHKVNCFKIKHLKNKNMPQNNVQSF